MPNWQQHADMLVRKIEEAGVDTLDYDGYRISVDPHIGWAIRRLYTVEPPHPPA